MFIVPVVQLLSPARLFVTPMDFYLLLDYAQFTLIHELNIPGSYAILSFISSLTQNQWNRTENSEIDALKYSKLNL